MLPIVRALVALPLAVNEYKKKFSVKKEIQSKKLEKKMFLEVRNLAFIKRTAS